MISDQEGYLLLLLYFSSESQRIVLDAYIWARFICYINIGCQWMILHTLHIYCSLLIQHTYHWRMNKKSCLSLSLSKMMYFMRQKKVVHNTAAQKPVFNERILPCICPLPTFILKNIYQCTKVIFYSACLIKQAK